MLSKEEGKALKEALKLPGMEAHLRRKKAAWKAPNPPKRTIYLWVQHQIAQELHSKLMGMPISVLLQMKKGVPYAVKEE